MKLSEELREEYGMQGYSDRAAELEAVAAAWEEVFRQVCEDWGVEEESYEDMARRKMEATK